MSTCGTAGCSSEGDALIPVLVESTPWEEVGVGKTDSYIHGDMEKTKQGRAMGYTKAKGHTVPSLPPEPPQLADPQRELPAKQYVFAEPPHHTAESRMGLLTDNNVVMPRGLPVTPVLGLTLLNAAHSLDKP